MGRRRPQREEGRKCFDSVYRKMWEKRRWKRALACQLLTWLPLAKTKIMLFSLPSSVAFLQIAWELMTNQSQVVKFKTKHHLPSLNRKINRKNNRLQERPMALSGPSRAQSRGGRRLLGPCSLDVHSPRELGAQEVNRWSKVTQQVVSRTRIQIPLTQSPGSFLWRRGTIAECSFTVALKRGVGKGPHLWKGPKWED